jgi:lipopolysaccharide/colanic/teichoic acid biosynthesis glycosyltransferase
MRAEALQAGTTEVDREQPRSELPLMAAHEPPELVVTATAAGAVALEPTAPAVGLRRQRSGRARRAIDSAVKRLLDVTVAALLLLIMSPFIIAVILLIRLDSPGPAFFRCSRVGYRGGPLRMLKFRKMHDGATGPALTTIDDHRFTRVGGWLAKTKIDEIPQLWHVLRGEMSLVGPRPEDPRFVADHGAEFETILSVRPGITGYSQLAFVDESRILDYHDPLAHYIERLLRQKIGLDRMYAEHHSPLVDLKVLFWTVVTVVLGCQVAVHRDSGRMNLRHR